jgi:branched-chain amino acid transport system substrate-binding protein
MKRFGIAAVVLSVLVCVTQAQTIKIATQSPLSGGDAALGDQIKLGTQVALEEAKAKFQALGYKLELAAFDDQGNPDTGVANANRIINDAEILGIVGHFNSGVAIPSSEVYARVSLVMVSPANTNPRVTDRKLPAVNRICGRDDVQGPAGAEFAVKELKVKKIFVIHDKTAYGQGLADNFRKTAIAQGVGIPATAFVGTEEKSNFIPLIAQIMAYKPDLIFFGGMYSQVAVFAKQLNDRGLSMPILSGDGIDSSEYERLAGSAAARNTYYTTVAGPVSAFPEAKAFLETYKAKTGKTAEGFSIYSYDCANVILAALESSIKAKGGKLPSREEVAKAVRATKLKGLTGTIEFDSKGDIKVADYFVMKVAGVGDWSKNAMLKNISVSAPQLQ